MLQKFLLNTKTYKLVAATVIADTTNSKKAIYFLSLTCCSINKLKSHMSVICKNFVFSNFMWKKIAPGNDREKGVSAPVRLPFVYGSEYLFYFMPPTPSKIWEDKGQKNTANFGRDTSFFSQKLNCNIFNYNS